MTHNDESKRAMIEGLIRLLDTFGADRSRWPARERLKYSSFIVENSEARRLVAEAEALDALLDSAPEPRPANMDAVTARIMAAAGVAQGSRQAGVSLFRPRAALRRPAGDSLVGWPAAALLAASLVLGVFAGTTEYADEPIRSIAALAVPQTDTDEDASQLAFGNEDTDVIEEELL